VNKTVSATIHKTHLHFHKHTLQVIRLDEGATDNHDEPTVFRVEVAKVVGFQDGDYWSSRHVD
jgi:hypothetical protein